MTLPNELPRPPYFLLFEEQEGSPPLAVEMGERSTLPLFASRDAAQTFADSMNLGEDFRAVEVFQDHLIKVLEDLESQVEHVALNPPPESAAGMKVKMGSLIELVEALRQRQQEEDLFGLGGLSEN